MRNLHFGLESENKSLKEFVQHSHTAFSSTSQFVLVFHFSKQQRTAAVSPKTDIEMNYCLAEYAKTCI